MSSLTVSNAVDTIRDEHITQRDALAGRLFEQIISTMEVMAIYLGDRLGLYSALATGGPATADELATRAGIAPRYAREWLEQQAVAAILTVDDATATAEARRYALPPGHAEVLLNRDSLSYLAAVARFTIGLAKPIEALVDAFRSGAGVAYTAYGPDAREGQADGNRTMFINLLASEWFPAIGDVHARLRSDRPARVADLGCGTGWSSLAIARAYPNVRVDGFDLDAASIELAQANAWQTGLTDRVAFHLRDAADTELIGQYDLAVAFECLHDMSQPVAALRTMRRLVGDRGTVIIVDERVDEEFSAPGDSTHRLMYGWSVLFCLPTGLADALSAGTGTVMRPGTLRQYAAEAGFRSVEILPIEHDLWRFYRLHV